MKRRLIADLGNTQQPANPTVIVKATVNGAIIGVIAALIGRSDPML
jgi:hypothetical protein